MMNWKEAFVAYFRELSQHLPAANDETPQPQYTVYGLRLATNIF
jgi:hypothetical protein